MQRFGLLLAVALLTLLGSFAFVDRSTAGERTLKTTVTLTSSMANIRVAGVRTTYRLKSSAGELSCFAVRNGTITRLRSIPPTSSANGMGCACGVRCWEDHQQQASVCVCRSCGGGGPLPVLIVIADSQ